MLEDPTRSVAQEPEAWGYQLWLGSFLVLIKVCGVSIVALAEGLVCFLCHCSWAQQTPSSYLYYFALDPHSKSWALYRRVLGLRLWPQSVFRPSQLDSCAWLSSFHWRTDHTCVLVRLYCLCVLVKMWIKVINIVTNHFVSLSLSPSSSLSNTHTLSFSLSLFLILSVSLSLSLSESLFLSFARSVSLCISIPFLFSVCLCLSFSLCLFCSTSLFYSLFLTSLSFSHGLFLSCGSSLSFSLSLFSHGLVFSWGLSLDLSLSLCFPLSPSVPFSFSLTFFLYVLHSISLCFSISSSLCFSPSLFLSFPLFRFLSVSLLSLVLDDDCFYYHSWRNNVVIAFGTLSSFLI